MPERSPVTDNVAKVGLLLFNLLVGAVLLGDLWGLYSSEPLIPALKGWWPGMTPMFYMWVRVALELFMLGLLTTIFFRARQWKNKERQATPAPNEILHPAASSMLWRWDPEAGTLGPFCPTHPQERLFLKGKHGGRKVRDFEKDHLSFNWFVCPDDEKEEFTSLEAHANRVYELRAQVTSRFRNRYEEQGLATSNDTHDSGILEVTYLHSEMMWQSNLGGPLCPLLGEAPHNATLFLQITAKIMATPPRVVENIMLDLAGDSIGAKDWAPERIDQREVYLHFRLSSSTGYGKQPAHLIARAFGSNGGGIDKHFQGFVVIIAQSLSDLQKFSGTS